MTRKSEKRRKGSGIQTLLTRQEKLKYRLILEGIAVGLLAGLVSSAFRWTLMEAESIRTLFVESARQKLTLAVLGIFLLGALAVFIAALLKREPLISGSGIPQVEGELHGKINANWLEVLLAKFLGAVCAIGGGLSLGREGPSIQLGAMVGKGFSRLNNRFRTEEKLLMTCGAGAGLAAAFSAPLAGVVFSLEELHKSFSTEVLLSTMASAITADWIASYIFGLRPVFDLTVTNGLPLSHFWMVILLGIFMGAFGVFYNKALAVSQDFFAKLPTGWLKAGIPCVCVILLAALFAFTTLATRDTNQVASLAGYTPLTVASDSMSPTFRAGDLIIIRKCDPQTLKEGDIVTFHTIINNEFALNTHRITEIQDLGGARSYVTKGDNNELADIHMIADGDIVGKYVCHLAGFGKVMSFLSSSLGFLLVIVLPLLIFFIYQVYHLITVSIDLKKAIAVETAREQAQAAQAAAQSAPKPEEKTDTDAILAEAAQAKAEAEKARAEAQAALAEAKRLKEEAAKAVQAAGERNE
mgnify:CR=1 FL=1